MAVHSASVDDRAATARQPLVKVNTGIQGLDEVLEGGLPVGRTTLITGGPGTGKTVMALELAYRLATAGRPALMLSFEERADALRTNAATLGFDLAELEEAKALKLTYAEPPTKAVRSGEFDLRGLLALLGGQVEALGVQVVVLDAIDQLMRTFDDPERVRTELHAVHDWLLDHQLTGVLTLKADPNGELQYPFLGFLTDCVLHLDQRMEGQVRTRRLRVVKYRGSGFLSNEYPYLLSASGVIVMPVTSAILAGSTSDPLLSSGDMALDQILGGGYRAGSAVLLAGPTGVGKTTLAALFARAACDRRENVLYVSFEEPPESMFMSLKQIGVDLQRLVDAGQLTMLARMPEATVPEAHLLDMLQTIDTIRARHVVIDAISAVRRMGSEQAAFDVLVRLIAYCKREGITCLLTNQTTEPGQVHRISGIGISSLVDTIVVVHYVDVDDAVRRRLLVVKSRGARHSNQYHWLELTDSGISLSSTAAETPELPAGKPTPRGSRT